MTIDIKPGEDGQDAPDRQAQLKLLRESLSPFLRKYIFIISGDQEIRETIRGYLESLGFFPEKIRAYNTSAPLISRLKTDPDSIDLIICNLKALDSSVSSKTGLQLLNIVKDMLLTAGSGKAIPFIFVERAFDSKSILSACKAGASQFLVVPSDPLACGAKLEEAFGKPGAISALEREVSAYLLEGNMLQEKGLYEQAIAYYDKALRLGGENIEILTEKANALMKMGNVEEAIGLYKRITEMEFHFPRAYQGLGTAYEQLGDFHKAKKNYQRVIDLEPENAQVHYQLGALYQDEGDYEKAEFYFRQGMNINKTFIKNYLGLAKNYEALDDPKKSVNIYRKAIEYNPNQNFLYLLLGDFCLKHNLNQEAEEAFEEAISLNSKNIYLYNGRGIALRKQGKFGEAVANYLKALNIQPNDPNLHYNLAKAYCLKGEEERAIKELNRAFELNPELKLKFEGDQYFLKLMEKYPDKFVK